MLVVAKTSGYQTFVNANDGVLAVGTPEAESYAREADDWHPRARDIPELRKRLVDDWSPDGSFTRLAPQMRAVTNGKHDWIPAWEYATAKLAQLWYVGPDMVDLLQAAAPSLPATTFTEEMLPDEDGLVVFGKPLLGVDSAGDTEPVRVGAYVWGKAEIVGNMGIGISAYTSLVNDRLLPIGSLSWVFGRTADEFLDTSRPHWDQAARSMAEDRRVLQALWLLSSQPGVATVRTELPHRQLARRMQRAGYASSNVRVITLRPQVREASEAASGREYQHRWVVNGHWRNQPYGPERSLRKPVFIHPYLKGPEDAPLLARETVKSWTR